MSSVVSGVVYTRVLFTHGCKICSKKIAVEGGQGHD